MCIGFLTSTGVYAGTVNCNNNSGHAGLIQSAVNAGGTVTISSTCATNVAVNVNLAGTTITGSGNPHLIGVKYFFVHELLIPEPRHCPWALIRSPAIFGMKFDYVGTNAH
jgi:hypothetical protein